MALPKTPARPVSGTRTGGKRGGQTPEPLPAETPKQGTATHEGEVLHPLEAAKPEMPVRRGKVAGARWVLAPGEGSAPANLIIHLAKPGAGGDPVITLPMAVYDSTTATALDGLTRQVAKLTAAEKYIPRFAFGPVLSAIEWEAVFMEVDTGKPLHSFAAIRHPSNETIGEFEQGYNRVSITRHVATERFGLTLVRDFANPNKHAALVRLELPLATEPTHGEAQTLSFWVWQLHGQNRLPTGKKLWGTLFISARDAQGNLLFDEKNPPTPRAAAKILADMIQKRVTLDIHGLSPRMAYAEATESRATTTPHRPITTKHQLS